MQINVQFDGDYTYVIVGLNPETEYEVLVYQTTSRQTCGNCANFTTIAAQGMYCGRGLNFPFQWDR